MTTDENLLKRVSGQWSPEALRTMKEILAGGSKVAITAHRSPDGDAVGSVLGLFHLLAGQGIKASVVLPDRYAAFLDWMPGTEAICFHSEQPEESEEIIRSADALFCLDFNAPERAGSLADVIVSSSARRVMIDHHRDPSSFAELLVSDPSCGSTCELICDWAIASGIWSDTSLDAAKCLYTGIVTDTGSFRFPSVSAHTHSVIAALLDLGLKHSEVHEATFDDQSLSRVQLHGFALSERLKIWKDAGIGVIALDLGDLERFDYVSGDTEGLVNRILGIRGIQMAIFMRESEPGKVKMSLRSKGSIDVQALASAHFDGGGHTNAAGGILRGMTLSEASLKVDEVLGQWFNA
jgi:phosphoesterase RecJ-like protein